MKLLRLLFLLALVPFVAHAAEAKAQPADKTPAETKGAADKDKAADKDSCCDDEKKPETKADNSDAKTEAKK